ncbi:hypothetical protein Hanom_Chr12g01099071 [Helianthus anomalus]
MRTKHPLSFQILHNPTKLNNLSNPEVAGSSLARSQCPYGSGFTPRLRLAGWRSAR